MDSWVKINLVNSYLL